MPVRIRLTAMFAIVMAAVLIGTGAFVLIRLRGDLRRAEDAGLRSRAEILVADGSGSSLGQDQRLIEADEAFAQILGSGGSVVESSPGLVGPLLGPTEVAQVPGPRFFDKRIRLGDEVTPARLLAVPTDGTRMVVVGTSVEERAETLGALARLLAIGGLAVLALATWAVWLLTGVALRPVVRMGEEAEAVALSEPGRRLTVPSTGDEIARLGESLNRMLERLEQALDRERRFVDQASHELRTPVATLKGELELALLRSRTRSELEDALRRAAAESEDLARLTEDLLVLARADQGRLPVRRSAVDLAALVDQVRGTFSERAEVAGISIEAAIDEGCVGDLDPMRLRQALSNLVDNALRHVPSGGRVVIGGSRVGGVLVLEVEDSGPGFPEALRSRPIEPFGPVGSDGDQRGGGLGLPIVRAVVEAHGGSVTLENPSGGGARVLLRFPGA